MRTRSRIILVGIALSVILTVATGGALNVKQEVAKKENAALEADKKLMVEEKPRIEKYLVYNYENIKSVTLTEVDHNPTGTPHILGYVNGDKELSFDAGIYDEHFETALDATGNSFPHTKLPDHETLTVSEIDALEK